MLTEQEEPEKRIADLEHQLAEQKRGADLRPAHHDLEVAFPSQTPGYQDREQMKIIRVIVMTFALIPVFVAGYFILRDGTDRGDAAFVWLGAAMIFLCGLIPVILTVKSRVARKKETPLREPGTVELLTVATAYGKAPYGSRTAAWKLTSEMQIRLDSGHAFRGTYCAWFTVWRLQDLWPRAFPREPGRLSRPFPRNEREAVEAIFPVGASWPCLYNPKNPDAVFAFPFAAKGDRLITTDKQVVWTSPDYVSFSSAT